MKKTLILLAMVAALMILPFFINHGGEFGGSDGEAESQIQVVAPAGGAGITSAVAIYNEIIGETSRAVDATS